VDVDLFRDSPTGHLVPIHGTDPRFGEWRHVAFTPDPLPPETPALSTRTFNEVARARAALAALDSWARQLPNPALLRQPTLRREAQSTSALEGTYAPLEDVLAAGDEEPDSGTVREILNYVRAAEYGFAWIGDGRPVTVGLLEDVQKRLLEATAAGETHAGRVREIQVMIGSHPGSRIQDARFVPPPPGGDLDRLISDLVGWIGTDLDAIDPVVASGMAHYQFETIHPFNDGNGRIGRLLVVLQLLRGGVLSEPTLTISPWFEARRADYYDRLLGVSATGDWDAWLRFFAQGLTASADDTARQLRALLDAQASMKATIRAGGLRAETAMQLVDFSLARPIFTVRQVEAQLGVTYARANGLVGQLVRLGVLQQYDNASYDRRFVAPLVLSVLLASP
jgi:Fic family protein